MDGHRLSQIQVAVEESLAVVSAHRFIRDARSGRLSEAQCQRWIMCAGRESRSGPEILQNMLDRASDEPLRRLLVDKLHDERGADRYLRLLRDIGTSEIEICDYDDKAGIRFSLDLAHNVSVQPDFALAIGYMYVNEAVAPIVHGAMELAIRHCYPGLTTDFFQTDVEVDAARVGRLSEAVGRMSDGDQDGVLFGVTVGERGTAALLDEALGLFAHWPRGPGANPRPTD
jgi:pyrroloquinoline quinone (PQQ) biosynthesis protein C